jgi:UDP-N-acetylglucosamine 2-epimerase (non-hydrolysing)
MKVAPIIKAAQKWNAALAFSDPQSTVAQGHGSPSTVAQSPCRVEVLSSGTKTEPPSGPSTLNPRLSTKLVHTGQHYDAKMSDIFFQELGIPAPDINLEVGSGSHAQQTANIMLRFEPVLIQEKPDWVIVVGDVNSTVACTLVAAKLGIKVAHVEAGLRSFDRTMPEEINRLVTDSIADLLLTPSEDANENLRREGVADEKIRLVGNIMIDSLVENLDKARARQTFSKLGLASKEFIYVTLHRPSNVDHKESLQAIWASLRRISEEIPVVFPIHPRTRKMLVDFGLIPSAVEPSTLNGQPSTRFHLLDPIGYHDSLCLTEHARLVLTDSGGLQEESTYFRTPCLTLRPNTERPVTLTVGSNRLTKVATLPADLKSSLNGGASRGQVPTLWDGTTAQRILEALLQA